MTGAQWGAAFAPVFWALVIVAVVVAVRWWRKRK